MVVDQNLKQGEAVTGIFQSDVQGAQWLSHFYGIDIDDHTSSIRLVFISQTSTIACLFGTDICRTPIKIRCESKKCK